MTTDLSKKLIRTVSSVCILGTLTAAVAFAAGESPISIDKSLFSQAAIFPSKLDEIYASQTSTNPSAPSLTEQTGADAEAVSAADASVSTDVAAPAAKSAASAQADDTPAESAPPVSTPIYDLQTNHPDIAYTTKDGRPAGATIYTSGCCPVSVANILRNLCGITDATSENMCALATESGARYDGGTDPLKMLDAAAAKWGGFTYQYSTSMDELQQCLSEGGMALAHTGGATGGATGLFADNGHFVALVSGDASTITAVDPYWTENKWTGNEIRKTNAVETDVHGVVQVQTNAVGNACDYFYLIRKA
ncbi:hypothetical protein [Butyricicoccus sp.]|uniref:hypothetical protein n=1 Tax=Butyricicoccus sp. TaxID=2049021 RepID=UPI003D7CFF27